MTEYTETDSRSEIAALSHEVYRLTKQLEEQEQRHLEEAKPDRYDPFDNPTEYKGFCGDYSKILPRMTEAGYEIPLEPDYTERRNLRSSYRKSGWLMILQYLFTNGLGLLLVQLVLWIAMLINPNADINAISDYISGSSILVSLNMAVYVICNVGFSMLGMKWAGIKYTSLVRTNDFGAGRAFQYCMIGILIWTVALYASTITRGVFLKYGIDIVPDISDVGSTFLGQTVSLLYACLLAPLTEELFFRGVLLRTLAKSNQRFAIFASALFFGLVHGNLKQFIFATLVGIFLAHITLKHGSIIPAVIVHAFTNTAASILGAVAGINVTASLISYLVLLAAALLGVILLMVFLGRDKLPSTTPKQARRGLLVAASSIPFSGAVIIYTIHIVYKLVQQG